MKNNITCIFLFCVSLLFGQNENSKWYFGDHAGLDFMTNPPTILNNSANNSLYGCSTISDASGNLLFYTDGMTVYNKNQSVMANGTGLGTNTNTNNLSYQYSIIVKQPGNANTYFIFSNCNGAPQQSLIGIYYSVVDMSLAAGMGSVTIKNVVVSTVQPSGELTATKHCNGSDVWVLVHDYGNNNFRAFLVNSTGVNLTPVISSIGINGAISSHMKVSPSGKKMASVYNSFYLTLFDFDNTTGIVSNSLTLNTNSYESTEFSPDGTKLYSVSNNPSLSHRISQWDLCAGTNTLIAASEYTMVASNTNLQNWIQLAPDGKIYVTRFGQTSLGVVNNPNAPGAACNYVNTGQSIAPGICNYALPAFVSTPLPSPLFTYTALCQNVNYSNAAATSTAINNCSAATHSLISSSWDFGDPLTTTNNTSTAQSPTHLFSGVGTFTTTLILHYKCFNDTLKQVINITVPSPTFVVNGPATICKGDLAVFTASSTSAYTYSWSNGPTTSSISVTPTNNINYTVSVTNSSTGCGFYKVVSVTVNKCTSIENINAVLENVAVYPNPSSNILIVEYDLLNEAAGAETKGIEITITNLRGEIIFSKKLNSTKEEIDVSSWAKGIYLMKIKSGEKTGIKKLVVE